MGLVKVCQGCGAVLTKANDSEAHILPNALGGRLKPKGILCRACNTKLDEVADNALVTAFGDWPTLLNFPRDHGKHPPKLVGMLSGRKVWLHPDGSMRLHGVQYDFKPAGEGHQVSIGAGDMKTIRHLIARTNADLLRAYKDQDLKPGEQVPQLDPNEILQQAQVIDATNGDLLRLNLDFSPQAIFGGIVTAIWLYLIHTTGRAFLTWKDLLAFIEKVQRRGGQFRHLPQGLPGLRGPTIDLGHKIIVRSVPSTGKLIAYVEVLGALRVAGVFAEARPPVTLLEYIYAYDVGAQADRSKEFSINAAEFQRQDWRTVGFGPFDGKGLRPHIETSLRSLEALYRKRSATADTEETDADAPSQAGNDQPG